MNPIRNHRKRQNGAVLFLALTFLLLLTILAVTASSTSIMQERMVGGMRNRQLGLMGVESTLRGAEETLWNLNFNNARHPFPPCLGPTSTTLCAIKVRSDGTLPPYAQNFRTNRSWIDPSSDGAQTYARDMSAMTGDQITANLSTQPRFIIENLGDVLPDSAGKTGGVIQPAGGGASASTLVFYRITARSQGGTDAVVRIAESYYAAIDLGNTGINPN
ncbi:MAG: pilus assembly protein [Lysobacterales bacterium]|nr:pilus assembly protein [Xanthomonadales bacterium]MCB1611783.1 pilus assembly protein [Xanthomonadales bacterium]MCP5474689.1 pilus assembly protein [Rhodanobacteraceae bacterium]